MISRAHQAAAQDEDGNSVNFFQPEVPNVGKDGKAISPDTMVDLVRTAIEKNAFRIVFQPMINLYGENDEQFEVLLRLDDENENELLPGEFLGPAEEAGLLVKMDRWVILQSVKLLSEHRSGGSKARLFINISHKSISDDTFLSWMSVALKAARLPSDAIIFQIHENDATSYIKHAAKFSKGLAQLHCKTSINHFGCSLKPLNLLKHITPDYVKLDESFTKELEKSKEKQEELKGMVKSLQTRGVQTAISGVEDPMVLATLFEAGINFIQGYYVSPPMDNMDYDFASEDL